MKRRKFLHGAMGTVAVAASADFSFASTPCPPRITDGIASVSCGQATGNLSDAADSLGMGDSVQFTKNELQHHFDIQWQVQTIWYDDVRGELQYMGKPATSQSADYSHYVYDEAGDTWSTTGQSLFPGTGHIWNATFDPQNGDYWFRRYNDNALQWFDRSDGPNGNWKQTVSQSSPALNSGNPNLAAMGWHPNLFGPGNPGLLLWAVFRFFAYNPQTQSFSVLNPGNFPSNSPYWNRRAGQALYLPATDQLICFAGNEGNGHPAVLVDAGAGNSSDVISDGFVTPTSAPPIQIYGGGGGATHGHAVNHPDDPNRLLLLEEHGSSRVWESPNFGGSWSLQPYTHPFQSMNNSSDGEYTVGIVSKYGIVVGMTSDRDGGETVLWRPGS